MGKLEHLVVDANAFLKNVQLQEMGENIYTISEVVTEIRDSATRQRLQVLPYDLRLKEPLPEDVQFITKFSKATGDYPSLSAVDIRLMALAYQLTREQLGPEAAARILKTEPQTKAQTVIGSGSGEKSVLAVDKLESDTISKHDQQQASAAESEGEDNPELDDDNNDDEDDEEGWITPSNYKTKLKEMEGAVEPDECADQIPVACLTTDFAMQNVLLHIGLRVMSTNGMLVKTIRTYILRCYACFRTTSIMTKVFCPSCGNKTLKKVSVSYKEDGTLVLHLSKRVNLTGRGKKFPLPAPQGGKHANNPILAEDQRMPQQRPSKMGLQKNNPLGSDYIANTSPFTVNDVYSRASVLGINSKYAGTNYWDKKNPNEARKRTGKKKSH